MKLSTMARLLHEVHNRAIAPEYVRRLLASFPLNEPRLAETTKYKADQPSLVEPLSEREIEVLQLVSEGLTNQEIGSRLFLSLNTVKVHTRNISGKLGVNNRTQAAGRAKDLGILPST